MDCGQRRNDKPEKTNIDQCEYCWSPIIMSEDVEAKFGPGKAYCGFCGQRYYIESVDEFAEYKKYLSELEKDPFYYIERTAITFVRNKHTFAIFGNIAYDVSTQEWTNDEGKKFKFRPVTIDNEFIHISVDEGSNPGIVGYFSVNDEEYLTEFRCGWFYTRELNLSNYEISENTATMLDNGTLSLPGRF